MNGIGKKISVESTSPGSKGRTAILHVAPSQERWSVRSDASVRARGIYDSRQKAVASAKGIIKDAGIVVVHGKDGRVDYIISKDGRKL